MKKFASLLLALVMILSLATTAFAAGDGSITITNANPNETYTAYKIFDVIYSGDNYAYSIAANSQWLSTVQSYNDITLTLDVSGNAYVVAKGEDFDAAEFAAHLSAAATGKTGIAMTVNAEAMTATATATGLELGYYLVDTTLGTLCTLDTTNPSFEIAEKNIEPTIKKEVKEDSTDAFGESNTAQVGDTVYFKTTVTAQKGAENYVVHDTMDAGLTFQNDIKITNLTLTDDYTVSTTNDDGCTFEITFTETYLDSITAQTDITITYSAILNGNAVISTATNKNKTTLTYGAGTTSVEDETSTATFMFNLVKTDSANKLLDGAEFELYDAKTGGNKIALVKEANGNYRIATAAEKAVDGFSSSIIDVVNGEAVVEGLDANTTYYLQETATPAGYNTLAERAEVKMENANLTATVTDGVWTSGGVHVVNNAGSELPSTGGMGTTLFYVVGISLMLGAAVLLITKKRMTMN